MGAQQESTDGQVLVQQGSTLTNDPAKGAHQVPPDGQCIIQDVRVSNNQI